MHPKSLLAHLYRSFFPYLMYLAKKNTLFFVLFYIVNTLFFSYLTLGFQEWCIILQLCEYWINIVLIFASSNYV